jgi:hypothetical protein
MRIAHSKLGQRQCYFQKCLQHSSLSAGLCPTLLAQLSTQLGVAMLGICNKDVLHLHMVG